MQLKIREKGKNVKTKEDVKTEENVKTKEVKNKLINFRVTPSEYEALHLRAKTLGVSLSELIIDSILM